MQVLNRQPEKRFNSFSGCLLYWLGLLASGLVGLRMAACHAFGEALLLLFLHGYIFLLLRGGEHLEGGVAGFEHLQFALGVLAF